MTEGERRSAPPSAPDGGSAGQPGSRPQTPGVEVDRLLRDGLAVLEVVARRMERRLDGLVATEDLLAFGRLAVLEIVRSYDPMRASFAPYCAMRLKWALLDAVRRETHGRVAARARALHAAETFAEGYADGCEEAGPPSSHEAAEARLGTLLAGHAASMSLALVTTAPGVEEAADPAVSPEDRLALLQVAERLRALVVVLPARERALVERHYWEEEPLETIAKDIGVSKSWASRLHAQAIERLAKELSKLAP